MKPVVELENTVELALTLGQAIVTLLNTTPTINGKVLYALGKNEQKLESYAKKYRLKQNELLKKYAVKDEDGNIQYKDQKDMVPEGNPFLFDNESDEQAYEKEANDYLKGKVKDFPELHKVEKIHFDSMTVNPAQNRTFPTLVDYLSV